MLARISLPGKTAMQSGKTKTRLWQSWSLRRFPRASPTP